MPTIELHNFDGLKLLRELPAAYASAIITDPPYCSGGILPTQKNVATGSKYLDRSDNLPDFDMDSMDTRNYTHWSIFWMQEARRVVGKGYLICFTDWRMWSALYDSAQMAGWSVKGMGIWLKTSKLGKLTGRPRKNGFRSSTELILLASTGAPTPDKDVYLPNVFPSTPINSHNKTHQTQKPELLMQQLIKLVDKTRPIVDPFAGSAATLIAAHQSGYNSIGSEVNATIYNNAQKRIQQLK